MLPRRFALIRHVDYTGSGTGVIAYGVAFDDGQVVLRWSSAHRATSVLDSVEDLIAAHGHGEASSIEWIDAPPGQTDDALAQPGGRRAKRLATPDVQDAETTAKPGPPLGSAAERADVSPAPPAQSADTAPDIGTAAPAAPEAGSQSDSAGLTTAQAPAGMEQTTEPTGPVANPTSTDPIPRVPHPPVPEPEPTQPPATLPGVSYSASASVQHTQSAARFARADEPAGVAPYMPKRDLPVPAAEPSPSGTAEQPTSIAPAAASEHLSVESRDLADELPPRRHEVIATQPMSDLSQRPRRAERTADSPRSIFDETEDEEPRRPDLRLASSSGRDDGLADHDEHDAEKSGRESFQGFFRTGHQHLETVTGLLDLPASLTNRGRTNRHAAVDDEIAARRNGRHRGE